MITVFIGLNLKTRGSNQPCEEGRLLLLLLDNQLEKVYNIFLTGEKYERPSIRFSTAHV
jgi:hypothetical protein